MGKKRVIGELLNKYKLQLDYSDSMSSGNLKFVEQYINRAVKNNELTDAILFLQDAIDIAINMKAKKRIYRLKFGL